MEAAEASKGDMDVAINLFVSRILQENGAAALLRMMVGSEQSELLAKKKLQEVSRRPVEP